MYMSGNFRTPTPSLGLPRNFESKLTLCNTCSAQSKFFLARCFMPSSPDFRRTGHQDLEGSVYCVQLTLSIILVVVYTMLYAFYSVLLTVYCIMDRVYCPEYRVYSS